MVYMTAAHLVLVISSVLPSVALGRLCRVPQQHLDDWKGLYVAVFSVRLV